MGGIQTVLVALLLCLGPMAPLTVLGTHEDPDAIPSIELLDPPTMTPLKDSELLSNLGGFFTENLGQYGMGTGSFYCQGEPLSVALGSGWVSYHHRAEDAEEGVLVRVDFEGADPVKPVGTEPQSHPTNFLKGNDQDQWVIGARSFRQVRYEGLYEGIDLQYRFEEGMLKYDFIVGPFADISQIRMTFSGHDDLCLDGVTGDLIIRTPLVDMLDEAPVSFQGSPGSDEDIRTRFILLDDRTVSFQVDGYDPYLPLVIDPGLLFSTYIGGNGLDGAEMEVDEAGDVYLAGYSRSTDFPTTPGVISEYFLWGDQDAIVLKLKGDGSDLLFSTYVGSDGFDGGGDIALDADKNILLAGWTNSSNFPNTPGALTSDPNGVNDGFVMKLNDNCTGILWSAILGGTAFDGVFSLEFMSNGDIMVSGPTESDDFPMVDGCYDTSANGLQDWFASRLNHNGSELLRSTYIGGSDKEDTWNEDLVVGHDDEVYIALQTNSTDFPVSQDAFSEEYGGCWDTVVIKLDGNLTQMRYSTYLGGSINDAPTYFTVDKDGYVYLLGFTMSVSFPTTTGAYDRTYNRLGYSDSYLTKLSPDGSSLVYSTYFGGDGYDAGSCIQLGDDGLLYFTITTTSEDLQTTEHAYDTSHNGGLDIYFGVFDGENQSIRYGTYLGGSGDEEYWVLNRIHNGTATVIAMSDSADYPTTPGAFDRVHNGYTDIVASRLNVTLSDIVAPTRPINLTVRLENHSVQLDWEPPARSGGINLSGYRIFRNDIPGLLSRVAEVDPASTGHADRPPSIGMTYYYAVTAFNAIGESDWSNMVNVTYLTSPGPPTNLRAEAGCGTVQLNWSAPVETGGRPLLGYNLYRGTDVDDVTELVSQGTISSYLDEDVVNGLTYHYRVAALNDVGEGNLTPVVSVTLTGPPTPPLGITATAGDRNVTLLWEPPASDGGLPLLGYRILRGYQSGSLVNLIILDGDVTELVDGPLTNGITYHYAVQARNDRGYSPYSMEVNATPLGVPDMPLSLELSVDLGQVELTWKAPWDDGGFPVEGYIVYRGTSRAQLEHLVDLTADETRYLDVDPPIGQGLFYAVSARNAVGVGPPTPEQEAWPIDLPDPPSQFAVEPGMERVTLTWARPLSDGGSEVRGYIVHKGTSPDDLDPIRNLTWIDFEFVDTDVVTGTTYHFAVSTFTLLGEGRPSDPIQVTPYSTPSVPLDLAHERTEGLVTLSWSPPVDSGGSPVTEYLVYRGRDPSRLALLNTVTGVLTFEDSTVLEEVDYHYAVSAVNVGGEGPWTAVLYVPGWALPGPPIGLRASSDGTTVTLRWDPPVKDGGSPIRGYVILRGTSSVDLREVHIADPTGNYEDVDLEEGCTYHYALCAMNDMGAGERSRTVSVHVEAPDGTTPSPSPLLLFAIGSILIVAFVGGASMISEPAKYGLALLFLPLFSRLKKDQVLDNKNRYSILGIIIDRPGIHYNAIINEFGIPVGVVTHHLNILEREDFIRSVRDGRLKRFYSKYSNIPEDPRMTPEVLRKALVDLIGRKPGISQLDIINEMGIERDTISYHLRNMVKDDLLEASKRGKYTVYTLNGRK